MVHSIIFGGTKGLGRVVARQFAERGDKVSIVGRSQIPVADLMAGDIQCFTADITEPTSLLSTLDEIVSTRGKINYGVFLQRYRGKEDDWQGELQTTLTATKNAVEHLVPHFLPEGDKGFVMVSSVFSTYVGQGQAASYHVAKAGLDQLMRYYAVNLGAQNIRANGVTPFTFLKEESKSFYEQNEELMNLYQDIIPLKRMATTEDSAHIINFLCSPQAGFISGQNMVVDGGLSLVWPETLARRLTSL
ncbi:MAG: SDR family oxidoreductase [Legionellaceae bacterium]|nr:SDR family oxidoreductase [Legionellaceae bacterium]MBP9774367.1 SDR family oxidoreductase [Legionellaceae bacterium]